MPTWSSGYIADIAYTFGYYQELNPLRVKLAFLNAGLAVPAIEHACELGYGQGMSANIHAAASTVQWHGTDFNPAQASFAQELALLSGAGARLFDDAFADFAHRPDLPDFDFIGIHGIWSWISDANRAVIVDFIRRKLKVGGVLYISYNTMPGWATFAPLRHLMAEHTEVLGAKGFGIVSRINDALDFTEKLLATHPAYARVNPQITDRISRIKNQNHHYLAHEYFNRDWQPMHFATMIDWMEPTKVSYACSAHYLDYIDAANLTPTQQTLLKEIPDALFRESVRDFMVNQQFRRDYWVKGARKLNLLDQAEALRSQKVILVTHRPDIVLKIIGAMGEAMLSETIYIPILDALSDHKARSLGQIEQAVKDLGITFAQLAVAVMVLSGAGHLVAVQDEIVSSKAKKQTDKLNAYLVDKSRGSSDISYLASPVTGGGVAIGRFQQLFMLAHRQGHHHPADWVGFVWQVLASQDQRIIRDGKVCETAEENIAELTVQAATFAEKQLPILKALQII